MTHFLRSRAGSALVELALVLPMLLLILVGAMDFGRVFYMSMTLTNAARAGAQFGAQDPTAAMAANPASILSGMQTRAVSTATSNIGTISASANRVCQCATVSNPVATAPSICNGSLPTCAGGQRLVVSVTIAATATFSRVTPFPIPGIPQAFPVARTATLRVQ